MRKYIASCVFGATLLGFSFLAAPAAEAQTPCRQNNDYYVNPAVYEACMRRHNATPGDFGRREVRRTVRQEGFSSRRTFQGGGNRRIDWQSAVNQLDLSQGRDPARRPFDLRQGRNGCEPVPRPRANYERAMRAGFNACRYLEQTAYGGRGRVRAPQRRGGGYADANDARECALARQIGGMIGEALQGDRCERRRRRH